MNEGTLSLIIQWCLLCLIWMGSLDRPLTKVGLTRASLLAALTLSLVSSFVSWKLYFLPVQVSMSGAILPILSAGWLYVRFPRERRRLLLLAALLTAVLLTLFRMVLFKDPVLLVLDETTLIAIVTLVALFALTRDMRQQLFLLFLVLPLTDGLYMLQFLPQMERSEIGSEYAQDMLWSTFFLWGLALVAWSVVKKGWGVYRAVRSKSDSHR
ncbi:YphA family membrane protein [Brevibacillus sp. H7]|uniref:YphA family membrane protein n=1 Tax=Brevibacillus sp. H7 TaxID=3349138 RepID=UPI0037FF31EA